MAGQNVIEELNFRDGLQPARGHPERARPTMLASAERGIEKPGSLPYLRCNPAVGLEDAALSLYVPEVCLRGWASANVLRRKTARRSSRAHLVGKGQRQPFQPWSLARPCNWASDSNAADVGSTSGEYNIHSNRIDGRLFRGQR